MAGGIALVAALGGSGEVRGAAVAFGESERVVRVDESVPLEVVIAYEPGESGDLFSFGVRLDVAGPAASLLESIDVPDVLEFFGASGPPAFRDLDPAVMGVKGTVDALEPETPFYDGSLLAVYRMRFPTEGVYELSLAPFLTLGPTEELFVAGDGTVLDDSLTFGTARITVIPEPSTAGLAVAALAMVAATASRRRPDRRS